MNRIIEVAAKKGLTVKEGVKTQNNGKELKTYLFRRHDDDVVVPQFEKVAIDSVADDELEAFFDKYIMPAFDADIVKKDKGAPGYMIDLLRTGTVLPAAINAEANEELLRQIPHRRVMDLALVYRLIVSTGADGVSSVLYTNQNMLLAGVTEEDLFRRAVEYARENIRIEDIYDILDENGHMLENEEILNSRSGMVVIRNESLLFGAGLLALWALEDGIAIDLYSNKPLFVLPSSIHDVIVVIGADAGKEDIGFVTSMVKQVNATEVSPEERLSNSVYIYEPETKKVKLARCGEPLLGCDKEESLLREMLA